MRSTRWDQKQDNRILFTGKDGKSIYKTAMISTDSQLVQRLLDAGVSTRRRRDRADFSAGANSCVLGGADPDFHCARAVHVPEADEKMGGPNSMMFGMGKSNAKVYVKSAEGIKFYDVAGEDEAKESLTEIVEYLHDPGISGNRRHHAQGHPAGRPSGHR
ncbi:MAG: hypothetical protein V8R27_03080 [Oscillospiraceae bacterium]